MVRPRASPSCTFTPRIGASPAHVRGVEGHIAHAFGATGNDNVVVAVSNLQAGLDDGLQPRSATAIDLHTGNGDRQSGVQCHDPPDRGSLAAGITMAEDHVLHCARVDSGALQQALQCGDAEVDGGQRLEHAAVAADRRPNRLADHGFTHGRTPFAETDKWARKCE